MKKMSLHLQMWITSIILIYAIQTIPLGISNTMVYIFSPDLAEIEISLRLILIFLFTYGSLILMLLDFVWYVRYLFHENEHLAKQMQFLCGLTLICVMLGVWCWHMDLGYIMQYF